jgi:hypothetical protein
LLAHRGGRLRHAPGEWLVCPLCGGRPEQAATPPVQAGFTEAEGAARLADPDARPARLWARRAGLWPVFLGGFVLLVVLPALVWVALVNWQQRVAEQQHLRDVETELSMRRAEAEQTLALAKENLQQAFMQADKARAALDAQELSTLKERGEQSEPRSSLKKSEDGEKGKPALPCPCGASCRAGKR